MRLPRLRTLRDRRASVATTTAAALLLSIVGLVAPPHASAAHTPTPSMVALVGSLQSEVGCPGDWQPDCEASELFTTTTPGVYESVFDVPAGEFEFKVALNGGWDENYGADGVAGGANLPLVLVGPVALRFSYDHATHRIAVAPAVAPPGLTPEDAALAGTSLRSGLTRERFYFLMTDRFANGDTSNDTGGYVGDRLVSGYDPTDKGFYHGGDLAGLISKLDYLKGLGTTAIWLTPSFVNRPVQGTGTNVSAGYHGYWITDFTQIDPHMGTNADLRRLVDRAHAKGMKVFFDIITNHTADIIDFREAQYSYRDKAGYPYKDASGATFDDRDYAGGSTFPALDPAISFPYTPFLHPGDESRKTPAWLNDITLYHNRGDAKFDGGESDQYGDFFGLDDLFTEQPAVVQGMTDIYKTWVDFGIDGFRIDTAKHVNNEFWQSFMPAIQAQAIAQGNPDFFSFGEVYDANPEFTSRYTTEAGFPATLDFAFQQRASGFGNGKATSELRDIFALDDYYTDTDSNVYSLPTFLGNHDMGRIGRFLSTTASGDELLKRDQLVHALMYLTRGQPVVYYGDEQGFVGDGGDKDARQDMFPSQVGSYNDDDLIGTDATTADANFDTRHPLYRRIAELARLRAAHPTLADGAQVHRYSSGSAGVYAFSRINARDQIEYVVATNNATTPKTVTFSTYSKNATFKGLWPAWARDQRTDREGRITVTVPPLTAVVWKAAAPLRPDRVSPAPFFRTPTPGGTVGGRAEIGVGVPGNDFNQTTIAWRPAGTEDWQALGTDDNAPYRVFHDVRGLKKGTLVEYRAVVKDHDGDLGVTSTYAAVGDPPSPGGGGGGGGPVVQPNFVSVPGSHNSEIGCSGDWQPDCLQAQMTLDPKDDVWKATFAIAPPGDYEYKAAIDKSWDENYGSGAVRNGANIPVTVGTDPVTFYYDHGTHWITSDASGPIITAPGSFQSELGCSGDWDPTCMRSWLQDPDGDGVFTFATTQIPTGNYEVKAAHGLSWDENYGQGGAPGGSNIPFSVPSDGTLTTFRYVLDTHVLTITTTKAGPSADLSKQKAQWVARGLVAWDLPADTRGWTFRLHWAPMGGLAVDDEAIVGGRSVPLTLDPTGLPADVLTRFPHLASYEALRLAPRDARRAEEILRGQVAVAAYDDLGRLADGTGVQLPGVLDDVYAGAYDRALGVTWNGGTPRLSVWAPTARDVRLLLRRPGAAADELVQMRRDDDGVWSVTGAPGWKGATYRYWVRVYVPSEKSVVTNRVTDPYSVALTADSKRSVIADLSDAALKPAGWQSLAKPALAKPEDGSIYELHVRDFSVTDASVPSAERGTYLAFTHPTSAGMQHLSALADAGLTTVHLLPTFDIATIPERRADQQSPPCDLPSFGPASEEQQACVGQVADTDGFNWGYDPLHYTTPEGSYATSPDGPARTLQYRKMVTGLNQAGLRVVVDVVYNHTAAAGQDPKSVLDQIVPGYYQRLSATGALETSTCCANTATEHAMMEKLMVDSVVTWAKQYKVDGFRFDLMGHHSLANMQKVRAALDSLTLARDGVDGRAIYVYGEGWNFGEVANDARFVQATQLNLAGTGIGSFSDRLRDAVRGGGPFDSNPRIQGFASGLYTDPNGDSVNGTADEQLSRLLLQHDQIKVGLAGNLRDYEFVDRTGAMVKGSQVDYNGSPAGYAADPAETITYVDAHDNETLFDALTYKLPDATSGDDRSRMNTVAHATTALAQGVSFWHAGSDILRSKSLDRNSYNSGDWFNRVDWTYSSSTFGSGLPPRGDNASKYPFMVPLLERADLRPASAQISAAAARAQELLEIRAGSPLFRLGSADLIQQRLSFPFGGSGQTPGVIVMRIDDGAGTDVDPWSEGMVVVFNATPSTTTQSLAAVAGTSYSLHPVQAGGSDAVVKTASYDATTGTFSVPARSVAVFTTT